MLLDALACDKFRILLCKQVKQVMTLSVLATAYRRQPGSLALLNAASDAFVAAPAAAPSLRGSTAGVAQAGCTVVQFHSDSEMVNYARFELHASSK